MIKQTEYKDLSRPQKNLFDELDLRLLNYSIKERMQILNLLINKHSGAKK